MGIRAAETTHIYAGDSGGNLHIIDQPESHSSAAANSAAATTTSTATNVASPSVIDDRVIPFEINKRW